MRPPRRSVAPVPAALLAAAFALAAAIGVAKPADHGPIDRYSDNTSPATSDAR